MKVYQTDNMENALIHMIARYDKAIVFQRHYCKRRIKLRREFLAGVPYTEAGPHTLYWDRRLQKWNRKKGILYYRPHSVIDKMPEADALLFVEPPLSYRTFLQYIDRIRRDVVVYRAPNWDFQDEVLNARLPTSGDLEVMQVLFDECGTLDNLKMQLLWATEFDKILSKSDTDMFCGFDHAKIMNVCRFGFKYNFRCYVPYTLIMEPDEPQLLETYKKLESELLAGKFLRNGKLWANQLNFKLLFAKGYIKCGEPLYILKNGHKPPDLHFLDALNNARRADWYKMKLIVEGAEHYSISI